MKSFNFSATVHVVSSLAVLAGILLLAYELNLTRQAMLAETRVRVNDRLQELAILRVSDPALTQIVMKANAGEELSDVEAERYRVLIRTYWRYRQETYFQYRQGLFNEDEYLALRGSWSLFVNRTPAPERDVFCLASALDPEFRAEINSLMEIPCE